MLGLFFVENDSIDSFVTRCALDDLTLSTAYLPASRTLESFIFPDTVSILTTRADSWGTRDIVKRESSVQCLEIQPTRLHKQHPMKGCISSV